MNNTDLNKVSVEVDFMYSYGTKMKMLQDEVEKLSKKYNVPLKVGFQYHENFKAIKGGQYKIYLNLYKMKEIDWKHEQMKLNLRMLFTYANVFLDDVRERPNESYIHLKNYTEFVDFIEECGLPEFISFDHDLGEEKTGFDCAKFLVEYCLDNGISKINFQVHSQNPVGKENIERLLGNFNKMA